MFKRKVFGQSPTQDACQCQLKDCYSRFREDLHHSIQQVSLPIQIPAIFISPKII
jgi:hypothetical protein